MDLDAWPYPKQPAGAAGRDRARALLGRDLPRLHPRLPVLPGRDDHPPGARAVDRRPSATMVENGLAQVRLRGGRPAVAVERRPLRDRRDRQGAGRPLRGHATSRCRCRRTRVDAFNITLANEFSRNGRRSGLTFAPEGGSERMRKVINKMVTEEDLIRTVATAYSHGWRQVKLYFMCGLPTETDEDVLEIADLAKKVIAKGREVSGHNDIRCTVSIGGFVPKPHTPFQWAAQLDWRDHRRAAARSCATTCAPTGATARRSASATTTASRGIIEGLLSRGDRRVGRDHRGGLARRRPLRRLERALLLRPLGGGLPSSRSRARRSTSTGTRPASASTPRCCPGTTSTPGWTRTGSGRTGRTPSTPTRRRGRGLPLDAVLRLRRLPADGHRDPDRPDRARSSSRSR